MVLSKRSWMLFIFYVFLVLSLPFWWYTTAVSRSNLPLAEMKLKKNVPVEFLLKLRIFLAESLYNKVFIKESIKSKDWDYDICSSLNVPYVSCSVEYEKIISKSNYSDVQSTNNMEYVLVVNDDADGMFAQKDSLSIGSVRTSWGLASSSSVFTYKNVLKLYSEFIRSIFSRTIDSKLNRLRIPIAAQYNVVFSLLSEDVDHRISWDFIEAYNDWLVPFFNQLSGISSFTVGSEIIHKAPLKSAATPAYMEQHRQVTSAFYALMPSQIRHFLNEDDWNFSQNLSSSSRTLRFIIYIPSRDHSPLYIMDELDIIVPTNSFLIPEWGGAFIFNSNSTSHNENIRLSSISLKYPMEIFISQLKLMFGGKGVAADYSFPKEIVFKSSPTGLTDWEFDSMLWSRAQENIFRTTHILLNFVALVEARTHMTILDNIKYALETALAELNNSVAALAVGNLVVAVNASNIAWSRANDGLFDHRMVSSLYFPNEHKIAIYVPLMIPILIPMIMALIRQIRHRSSAKVIEEAKSK